MTLRHLRTLRPLAAAAGAAVVATVVSGFALMDRPVDELDLSGQTFVSSQVDGRDLVAGTEVTLTFGDDHVSASAGCNTIFGAASWDAGVLEAPVLASTMRACLTPEIAEQDAWLAALLADGPELTLTGTTLEVTDGVTTVVLQPA